MEVEYLDARSEQGRLDGVEGKGVGKVAEEDIVLKVDREPPDAGRMQQRSQVLLEIGGNLGIGDDARDGERVPGHAVFHEAMCPRGASRREMRAAIGDHVV